MIVVSDTTPLISLLKINRIDLLEKLFGDVLIPQAVFDELTVDERFRLEADEIRQKKFIVVKPVNNPESASILKRAAGLDQGESEAIVLSDELKADLLLMDEAKGRNVSAQMGLRIMGTIGILMAAYEEHELTSDEVRECVNGLQRAGRHIGQRHYQMLLKAGIHPFAAGRYMDAAKRYELGELRTVMEEGAQLEQNVKTGLMTDTLAVELFIVKNSGKQ